MKKNILPIILSIIFIIMTVLVSTHYYPIDNIDQTVFSDTRTIQNPSLTKVLKIFTNLGNPLPATVIGIIIIIILFLKKKLLDIGIITTSILATLGIVEILKDLIERARPIGGIIEESGWSFPSGHASFAGLMAVVIFYIFIKNMRRFPRLICSGILALTAIGIAYSRIYLGVHWTSDVVAGVLLGTSVALFTINTLKPITKATPETVTQQAK